MALELQYPELAARAQDITHRLDVSGLLDKLNEDREHGSDRFEANPPDRRKNRLRSPILHMPLFIGEIVSQGDLVLDRRLRSSVQIYATITNWHDGEYNHRYDNVTVLVPIEALCFCPPSPNTDRSKWYYARSPHLERERLRIASTLYHEFIHCHQATTGPIAATGQLSAVEHAKHPIEQVPIAEEIAFVIRERDPRTAYTFLLNDDSEAQYIIDGFFSSLCGYTRKMYLDDLLAEVLLKGNYDSLRKTSVTSKPVASTTEIPGIFHSYDNDYTILVPDDLLVRAASLLEPEMYIKGAFVYTLEGVKDGRASQRPIMGRFSKERTAKEREGAVIRENFALLGAYDYFIYNNHEVEHALSPIESKALVWEKMGVKL